MPSSRTLARGDVQADTAQQHLGVGFHAPPVDHAEAARLTAQEDVLGHGQIGNQVELLVDRGDPEPLGVLRAVDADLVPVGEDPAAVRAVGTGEHLDEGALARPVLTEQDVHLATAQVEVDAVQGHDAGEGLAYAFDAQQLV